MIVEWSFAMLALKRRRTDSKPTCSLPRLAISPTVEVAGKGHRGARRGERLCFGHGVSPFRIVVDLGTVYAAVGEPALIRIN